MTRSWGAAGFGVVVLALAVAARAAPKQQPPSAAAKRGEYLVTIGSCNDCHTPWKAGPNGPEPDISRLLSGHPEALVMPPAPSPASPWMATGSGTFTAWAGPWGVSFSSNLTPDAETGLGKWTEQNFIEAMRTGRHQGRGRQILPPMPWQSLAKATDADLKAIFAYLRTIPAIRNRVPDPIPPGEASAHGEGGAAAAGTANDAGQREGAPRPTP